MCELNKHVPQKMEELVGNQTAKEKIRNAVTKNGGHGGLAYFISGPTGSGKTTLAEIICREVDPERCDPVLDIGQSVFRPLCNRDDEMAKCVNRMLDSLAFSRSMYSNGVVFILDESDRLSSGAMSELKQVLDRLHTAAAHGRRKCDMTVILTTSKSREDLPAEKRKHWDELRDRCVRLDTGLTPEEFDDYFDTVTDTVIDHMSTCVESLSFRQAWDFIDETGIDVII